MAVLNYIGNEKSWHLNGPLIILLDPVSPKRKVTTAIIKCPSLLLHAYF